MSEGTKPVDFDLHRRGKTRRIPGTLLAGLVAMTIIVLGVAFAPIISPYDPVDQDIKNRFAPFSIEHPLGTDNFGRDELSRIVYGGRVDIALAFFATLLAMVIGSVAGLVGGYFGGRVDGLITGVTNLTMAFPVFVLVILVIAILGPGIGNLYVAIIAVSWVAYARLVRGEVLAIKGVEFVDAARMIGAGHRRIIFRHVFPNVFTVPLIYASSDAVLNMVFAGTLGYLGLGARPPSPEWGAMVAEGRAFIATFPRLVLIPSGMILVAGLSLSLIGDGLADLLRK